MKSLLILFLIFVQLCFAQENLPQDYFKPPLKVPLVLSGTFGELRPNHFHAGIDFKTQGVEGLEVVASASGYVSRIKIQQYGYGKALYVTHPNGYQTVYGHLKKFSPEIEEYVKALQYKNEKFEIQLFPEAGKLPVELEETIAYSGNTGSSQGAHLHFEIRDPSSRPMNPFLFGFEEVKDSRPPTFRNLYAYTASKDAHVNYKSGRVKLKPIQGRNGIWRVPEVEAAGEIYFGVEAYDRLDLAFNKNGYYEAETKLNGKPYFRSRFNRFSFGESRYLNRLIDYAYYKEFKKRIHKLRAFELNRLEINDVHVNNGILNINDTINYKYELKLRDFKDNSTEIHIPIAFKSSNDIKKESIKETLHFVQPEHAFAYDKGLIDVYIPKYALYEDTYLDIDIDGESVKLHDYRTPIHKSITIGFDVSEYSEEDKEKLYVGKKMPWGTIYHVNTKKKRNRFTVKVKEFGHYILTKDEDNPAITPLNFRNKQWLSNYRYLKVKIEDKTTGIGSYRATVNGKFILMEYDYKTNTLTHDFNDNVVSDTENNFKLVVTDNVGNTSIFESTFFRKK